MYAELHGLWPKLLPDLPGGLIRGGGFRFLELKGLAPLASTHDEYRRFTELGIDEGFQGCRCWEFFWGGFDSHTRTRPARLLIGFSAWARLWALGFADSLGVQQGLRQDLQLRALFRLGYSGGLEDFEIALH